MPKTISDVKVVTHKLDQSVPVTATPFIGEGQEGGWTIHRDSKIIASGTEPEAVDLGKPIDLLGFSVEISAGIKDTNQVTDRLTLEVAFTGGKTEPAAQISHVGEPGAVASYSIVVFFV